MRRRLPPNQRYSQQWGHAGARRNLGGGDWIPGLALLARNDDLLFFRGMFMPLRVVRGYEQTAWTAFFGRMTSRLFSEEQLTLMRRG